MTGLFNLLNLIYFTVFGASNNSYSSSLCIGSIPSHFRRPVQRFFFKFSSKYC
jgi:hypothetical protein